MESVEAAKNHTVGGKGQSLISGLRSSDLLTTDFIAVLGDKAGRVLSSGGDFGLMAPDLGAPGVREEVSIEQGGQHHSRLFPGQGYSVVD